MDKAIASARLRSQKQPPPVTSRQTGRRSTPPTRLGAPGPSHQRRGLRQAGSSTRGLHCPVAPVVCETTTSAQQKMRDQGMTKPPSLSSQPSLPTTKTSVEYNTNYNFRLCELRLVFSSVGPCIIPCECRGRQRIRWLLRLMPYNGVILMAVSI